MADNDIDAEFRAKHNTELEPSEEAKYQSWVKTQSKKVGRDVSKDEIDYDLRGDWKQGAERDERGHGGDLFKKPNHPTFSEESQYHGTPDEEGKPQVGGKWIRDKKGNVIAFEQSETNQRHWPEWAIKDYLGSQEKGVSLRKASPKPKD